MQKLYISLHCSNKKCNKQLILINEEFQGFKGYVVCPYCSRETLKVTGATDNLKDCMKERVYIRVNGAFRQVRNE